jgi:hypothetical protein
MANVYVEPRPKGHAVGARIDDYVVEDHADHALATFKTQHEAIEWAKKNGHTPHIARVRHLNDKQKADHWRAVQEARTAIKGEVCAIASAASPVTAANRRLSYLSTD